MKIVFKALLGILNLIYVVMKLFPVKERITFISRQSNEKSEDMLLLERELRRQMPGTELVFLCRRIDGGTWSKIGYCFHILTQMKYIGHIKGSGARLVLYKRECAQAASISCGDTDVARTRITEKIRAEHSR